MPVSPSLVNRWVVSPTPRPGMKLRLIAFPYAGAGASVFAAWCRLLPADVELCAVQMPGREGRLGESPITSWEDVIPKLAEALRPVLDRPFVFFGHSLGAALAFELAHHLRRHLQPGPLHLFVSGRCAPHLPHKRAPTYNLPQPQFVHELGRWGTPKEVLNDPELLDLFLPLLRADFGLSEMHAYRPETPLAIPISAYGGELDMHILPEDLDRWHDLTSAAFRRVLFPGDHFFLNEHRGVVLSELSKELHAIAAKQPIVFRPSV